MLTPITQHRTGARQAVVITWVKSHNLPRAVVSPIIKTALERTQRAQITKQAPKPARKQNKPPETSAEAIDATTKRKIINIINGRILSERLINITKDMSARDAVNGDVIIFRRNDCIIPVKVSTLKPLVRLMEDVISFEIVPAESAIKIISGNSKITLRAISPNLRKSRFEIIDIAQTNL